MTVRMTMVMLLMILMLPKLVPMLSLLQLLTMMTIVLMLMTLLMLPMLSLTMMIVISAAAPAAAASADAFLSQISSTAMPWQHQSEKVYLDTPPPQPTPPMVTASFIFLPSPFWVKFWALSGPTSPPALPFELSFGLGFLASREDWDGRLYWLEFYARRRCNCSTPLDGAPATFLLSTP